MTEGRDRTRKAAREAGPPSESDVTAAKQSSNSTSKGFDRGGANSSGSKFLQRSGERKNSGDAKKSRGSSNPSHRGSCGGRGGHEGDRGNNSRGGRGGHDGNRRNVAQSIQSVDLTQHLSSSPKTPKGGPRVATLGGISEIGRDMTVLEYKNRLIIVGCGVLFPSSDESGIDSILPDFSYIGDGWDRVEVLMVTHGHENHVGAILWLLRQYADILIIASHSTLALIQAKTQEHRQCPKIIEVNDISRIQHGLFGLRFSSVNHPIPKCLGVITKTGAGMIVYTDDVKMDQIPPDGKPTSLPTLSRYDDEGIDPFLCESANATIPGFSESEAELALTLHRLIMDVKQRVIVAAFTLNVYRVQAVTDAAVKVGRKVVFDDRSIIRNMRTAQKLGLLAVPGNTVVEMNEAVHMAPHKIVLVATGMQGEPIAVLSRMARREHHQIIVRDGDLIILNSPLIPGNEEVVFGVINMLAQIGTTAIAGEGTKVHTFGHDFVDELLFLYNAARLLGVIPVHGKWCHVRADKELAVSIGVKLGNAVLAQNGVVVDLVDGRARVVGQVPIDNFYADDITTGDVDADMPADRAEMCGGGLITVTVVIDSRTDRPLEKPRAQTRGYSDDAEEVLETAEQVVDDTLFDLAGSGENNPYRMAQEARHRTKRVTDQEWCRSPMIVPTIVPMSFETAEKVIDEETKESRESI